MFAPRTPRNKAAYLPPVAVGALSRTAGMAKEAETAATSFPNWTDALNTPAARRYCTAGHNGISLACLSPPLRYLAALALHNATRDRHRGGQNGVVTWLGRTGACYLQFALSSSPATWRTPVLRSPLPSPPILPLAAATLLRTHEQRALQPAVVPFPIPSRCRTLAGTSLPHSSCAPAPPPTYLYCLSFPHSLSTWGRRANSSSMDRRSKAGASPIRRGIPQTDVLLYHLIICLPPIMRTWRVNGCWAGTSFIITASHTGVRAENRRHARCARLPLTA